MSKNLWDSITPPDSRYVHMSKQVNSMAGGIQFFSFEYGPEGHAFPLNLQGVYARVEVGFSCQISNHRKAAFEANEYALNFLSAKFLIEARPILESCTPGYLKDNRLIISEKIMSKLSATFDEVGVCLKTVSIGAIDLITQVGYAPTSTSEISKKPEPDKIVNPLVSFFDYPLKNKTEYHIKIGMP